MSSPPAVISKYPKDFMFYRMLIMFEYVIWLAKYTATVIHETLDF